MRLKYPPVVSPFAPNQCVTLVTGEKGKAYQDGWGNMAYRHDDGVVYHWFLPSKARSLDSVKSVPLAQFVI